MAAPLPPAHRSPPFGIPQTFTDPLADWPPQVGEALEFGAIEFLTKYVLYFAHERLWSLVTLL